MKNKEYGGYLPLELNNGEEYFKEEHRLIRFNSIKSGITFAISKVRPKRVLVPFYYCPTTIEHIRKVCDISFYHVDEQLCPFDYEAFREDDRTDVVIILVDYFGTRYEEIVELANKISKATILLDFAHDFYAKPLIRSNVYNLYSAKKFFGVPDGSYVVSHDITCYDTEKYKKLSMSGDYNSYLIESYEKGTNAAYLKKKDADKIIASRYDTMSILARGLLKNVNYARVRERRISNFNILNNSLSMYNHYSIDNSRQYPAYYYPLMVADMDDIICERIKNTIVNNKIYIPTMWVGDALRVEGLPYEKRFTSRFIFLPIDQRYNIDDMIYISERVIRVINEYS